MKNRMGFVSNSSSSSFVIKNSNIIKLANLAHDMLGIVIEDFLDWDGNSNSLKRLHKKYSLWKSNLKKSLKKKDVQNGKIGIVMPSCNYDTYLLLKDNCVYVTTCNNHQWELNEVNCEDSDEGNKIYKLTEDVFFYDIRTGTIHSREKWDKEETPFSCPKCQDYNGSYVYDKRGNRLCGNCLKGKLEPTNADKLANLRKSIGNPIITLQLNNGGEK